MSSRWRWPARMAFVLLFVLPTLALMVVSIEHYKEDSIQTVMKAKELEGRLVATVITEKLDAQFDLATSFATRLLLIRNVEKQHWREAMGALDGVLDYYPNIESIVLLDPAAVVKAELPAAGGVGQSRADREWYREFSKREKPYLSNVYLRAVEPRRYVVSLVLPVYSLPAERGGKLLAILQVQLGLQGFYDWTKLNVGRKGLIYIVDRNGHLVHHSRRRNEDRIVDLSSVEIVRKALAGASGAELSYNPIDRETRVSCYQAMPQYGWGVVVAQAAEVALAERDRNLDTYYLSYGTLAVMAFLLSLAILRIVTIQRAAEERQRELALLDELTGLGNRRGFVTLSTPQLTTANRTKQKMFFVYADLNGMKLINDRLGHREGDRALVDTAQLLRTVFREADIKARIGGDEFVVLGSVRDGFDGETVKARLHKATLTFQAENKRPYALSLSTGIVFYDPEMPCSLEELMERGDRLMYQIKAERSPTPPRGAPPSEPGAAI